MKVLDWLWRQIGAEPVQFQGWVQSTIALGCAFGLKLSLAETAAILAWTQNGLNFLTRRAVTPTANAPNS